MRLGSKQAFVSVLAVSIAACGSGSSGSSGSGGGTIGGGVTPTPTSSPSATPTATPSASPSPTALIAHEFGDQAQLQSFLENNIEASLRSRFTLNNGIMRVAIVPSDADFSMGNISEHPIVLNNGVEEATLEYRFRFSPSFDFVKQGKLPGIASLRPHFGGNANDPVAPDSWSYRQMWVKFSSDATGVNGRPDMYLYDQFRKLGQTGEHYRGPAGTEFVGGQWYTARLYIKLNTKNAAGVAQFDGVAELWHGDRPLVCNSGLVLRGDNYTDESKIRRIAYHFYHGGARTPSELPTLPDGQWIDFDYIRLWEGKQTPRDSSGNLLSCNLAAPAKPDYP